MITLLSVGFTISAVILVVQYGGPAGIAVLSVALPGFFVPHFLHIRAALRGAEPGGPTLGLLIQAVAAYAPIMLLPGPLGGYWWGIPSILLGSVLLRLRPPLALGCLVPMAGVHFTAAWNAVAPEFAPIQAIYAVSTLFVTGFVIYVVVRLVIVSDDLAQARTELAEAAVLRERLRISRDLHDGLGSNLAAIALKGDLARNWWGTTPPRPRGARRTDPCGQGRRPGRAAGGAGLPGDVAGRRGAPGDGPAGGLRGELPDRSRPAGGASAHRRGAGLGGARGNHQRRTAQPRDELLDQHLHAGAPYGWSWSTTALRNVPPTAAG
ncbi:histidine kinase [Streptosporangium lutulentum]